MFICYYCKEVISGNIFMADDCSFCSCNHRNIYLKIFKSFNNEKIKKTISMNNINNINNTYSKPNKQNNYDEKKKSEINNFDICQACNFLKIKKYRICSSAIFKMIFN